MFGAFERMVALRYLRSRRQEGFISVIAGFSLMGIALGVATLIIVMSVMNGFRAELLGRILGLNGHLGVYAQAAGGLSDYDALAARLARLPGIVSAAPQIEGQVMATAGGAATGALVRGLKPEDMQARAILAGNIRYGRIEDVAGRDAVMIGTRMAEKFRIAVGDELTLIAPQFTNTAFGGVPRMRAYRVAAIFDIGMFEYDSTFVFLPLEAAQVFFRLPGQVNAVEVMVADPGRIGAYAAAIAAAAGPGHRLFDWQQANASFFNAIQVERNVMFLILTLIILVAAFNIISSLIMLVKDKGRDIAILRTMGASRGMILRIFFLTGASIGVVGTLIGFALGLAFCLNIEAIRQGLQALTGARLFAAEIYFLSKLPAKVDAFEVAQVVAMALGLSFLATIYPAWRAARQDPVDVLRYG
ncbi:MAG: lipoprotein-releasing ABC transporter permease subunit [Thalassobaculales bacterium]